MKTALIAALAVIACVPFVTAQDENQEVSALSCPKAGYMFPDANNLCFVWFCEFAGESPMKRPCPKGVRVPSWWEGGELAMCNIVNILKHGGEPTCLRCAANDVRPADNCADHDEPCDPGCTCIDQEHTHRCDCPVQNGVFYQPGEVEFPANHCEPDPCENGGTCQNQWDGYFCFCPNGWTGHRCETSVCDWHPCLNGGTCVIDEVGYHCECPECWTGSCCNVTTGVGCGIECGPCLTGADCSQPIVNCGCRSEPCTPGTQCVETDSGPECQACDDPCMGGSECKTRLDTCKCNNNCPENSRCEDLSDVQSHECICNDCWRGQNCDVLVDNCDCNPCPADAFCSMVDGKKSCGCGDCLTGEYCDQVIQTCACANPCPEGATCTDGPNGPTCGCSDPCATGSDCSQVIQTCECANPCLADQQCSQAADGSLQCSCSNPCMSGPQCDQLINDCACNNPCTSGGTCVMGDDGPQCSDCGDCMTGQYCNERISSCKCSNPCVEGETCTDGPNGPTCGCEDSCKTGPGCSQTVNTCECLKPCAENQECSMENGAPVCSCVNPCYTGADCSVQINSCLCSNPCVNGNCVDGLNGPVCEDCPDCYGGPRCDQPITSCKCNSPCNPGQECFMEDGAPQCSCLDCYTGPSCDEPINSCQCNNPCQNKDTCQDSANGPVCVCDCLGNEVCVDNAETGAKECKCPDCYMNLPGYNGCLSHMDHVCECNNPCTNEQETCVSQEVGTQPKCEITTQSAGNSFTVVFEENDTEKAYKNIPLELYITPSSPNSGSRTVNIRSPGLRHDHHCYFNVTLEVPENDVLRFPVERCMMHNQTGLDRVSIRLNEVHGNSMIVYGINKDRFSADGFLAIPDAHAGTKFQTVSYSPAHKATQFAIVALYDNTEVVLDLHGQNDLKGAEQGGRYTLTMKAFETFQVQASCPYDFTKKSYCSKDLTGTVITTSQPVHVFSGNIRTFIESGEAYSRDHLVEELVPVDRWGKYFGFVSIPKRVVGDLVNIMAVKGVPTNVDIYFRDEAGETVHTVINLPKNGEYFVHQQVPSNRRVVIKSDQPLSVTQWTKSKDEYRYFNETAHDPVSITVPPVEQFTNNFFFSTPLFTGGENFNLMPYNTTYAMMVAKQGDEAAITVDGRPITDFVMPWAPMPEVSGEDRLVGAVIKLEHGTRIIRNTENKDFQCLIYGFDDRESYGLPAAMNLAKIN